MPTLMEVPAAAPPVVIGTRMPSPAAVIPDAWEGIQKLLVAVQKGGLSADTLELTHLRASQVNGCAACIEGQVRHARRSGEAPSDRWLAVAAWRESSQFTAAERAALALTDAVTRLADRPDPVPDGIWDEAARHYDERALAALLLHIALTNLFNRLNVSTRQPAGDW